ncbi:hypothetical protein [Collimonas sp.]|jgi:hypothetical protein|uniref:hypothetical protein n=1 Tax=Collimonas sp. TaxID=1963772 RepID=UPI002BC69AA8|nr:hypothetical protein [Collimonas sp.]HWW06520.1 hypothetical protein [Collimonas sp.]
MKLKSIGRKLISPLSVILATSIPMSSALALGIVSRSCAPAGAQESISVDWGFKKNLLWTASSHYRNGAILHTTNTVNNAGSQNGWEYTWRSYAGHFGSEFWYGSVVGHHWRNDSGFISFLGNSYASDCNLRQWGTR